MDSIEPVTFNAARNVLAAAAAGLTAFILGRRKRLHPDVRSAEEIRNSKKDTVTGGVFCGLFLTAASIFQQMGLVYTTAGKAGFITAMYIVLVPVISLIVFRQKCGRAVWAAVGMSVFGMYLLCMTGDLSLTRGDALVSVCAVLFSGHILCIDHFVRKGDPIRIAAIQFLTCALISGVIAFIAETPSWEKIASAAVPILYCGLISGGLAYTLQIVAQKFTEPAVASLLMSLESVFAVIAGALILQERMTARELIGCAIMFAAIILIQIPVPTHRRRA